jgi:penicillin-binding protein 1A
LREALANSVNMVAIKLMRDIGIEAVIHFAQEIGVKSSLAPFLPLALGASAMRPIELANVYSVIASGGVLDEPRLIERVQGPTGGVIWQAMRKPKNVMDPAVAYLITDMMTSVVQSGTAKRVKKLGRPAAGKTGTTNGHTDAWFSGFVPGLVTTVWVGFDDNRSLGKGEQGAKTALPIWLEYMTAAVTGPTRAFMPPRRGISILKIDRETGLLAPEGLPEERVLIERFLTGTGPTEYATLPGEMDSDSFLLDQFGFGGDDLDSGSGASPPGAAAALTVAPAPRGAMPAAPAGRTVDPEDAPPQ